MNMLKIKLDVFDELDLKGNPIKDPKSEEVIVCRVKEYLVDQILSNVPIEGMLFKEVKDRLSLINKIEECEDGDDLLIQEAEWKVLKTAWDGIKFRIVSPTIVRLGNLILEPEKVKKLREVIDDEKDQDQG